MQNARGQFSSKLGFLMAAAGSAVGLGNIWGFPTQVATHGGGAFLLVYLVLAFALAYPALMAELIIGRHTRANVVTALSSLSENKYASKAGMLVGIFGVITASFILSFYAIVAGWMLAEFIVPMTQLLQTTDAENWIGSSSISRNITVCVIFSLCNAIIISQGVEKGIEAWSTRLMPILIFILICMIVYVLNQPGAWRGVTVYLVPNVADIFKPDLLLSALGQAFFSLSLGVGTMLIYGSYLRDEDNLPRMGAAVTLLDTGFAFIAGLLIIPAIYVAEHQGINTLNDNGELIAGPELIFQVLPNLFNSMGASGNIFALAFFALMTIAALTSSISMLEVPVSAAVEHWNISRKKATFTIASIILGISICIIWQFETTFNLIISLTTVYAEPLIGVALCLFAGWAFNRHQLLSELSRGHPDIEKSLFWKVWPFYVKWFCPVLILLAFVQSLR